MRKPRSILLVGGPFDGRRMLAIGHGALAIEGWPLDEHQAARYLPTADHSRYTYRGLATVTKRFEEAAA